MKKLPLSWFGQGQFYYGFIYQNRRGFQGCARRGDPGSVLQGRYLPESSPMHLEQTSLPLNSRTSSASPQKMQDGEYFFSTI